MKKKPRKKYRNPLGRVTLGRKAGAMKDRRMKRQATVAQRELELALAQVTYRKED